MGNKMGHTPEDVIDNIVKIADENGNCVGTGFFIHKEFCVTCHHNVCRLGEIFVEREQNNEKGQRKRRYPAEWVEEFSDMTKDVAFLKVKGADFKPLEYKRQTYGNILVVVTGFPLQDLYHFPDGQEERGTLTKYPRRFRWQDEEILVADKAEDKKKKWNMKPEVDVSVYAFEGKFHCGFSGSPVCYESDWEVVGMFEANDDNKGYIIPIDTVIKKFDLYERGGTVSAPSPTLDAEKILDKGNDHLYRREYLKAIEQYDKILSDKNYPAALNNKGWALGKSGRYEEAIPYYDKAIAIDPTHTDALDNKGWALFHLGRYEEAIEQFDKAIAIDPKYADAWDGKEWALRKLGKN